MVLRFKEVEIAQHGAVAPCDYAFGLGCSSRNFHPLHVVLPKMFSPNKSSKSGKTSNNLKHPKIDVFFLKHLISRVVFLCFPRWSPPPRPRFAVYRPTSRDAIAKMLSGIAVGKGLNVKGKSAKLSGTPRGSRLGGRFGTTTNQNLGVSNC